MTDNGSEQEHQPQVPEPQPDEPKPPEGSVIRESRDQPDGERLPQKPEPTDS